MKKHQTHWEHPAGFAKKTDVEATRTGSFVWRLVRRQRRRREEEEETLGEGEVKVQEETEA